jgi:cell division septation protein DedD
MNYPVEESAKRVIRVAAAAPPAAMAARSADAGGAFHRVRVGGYADRATAQRVQRELADKGFQPFIARARE